MKKFLLSLSAAVACMGMSAAVPVLKDLNKGSFNVTQETPNYSNPSAYDANGNLIITGAFNDVFGNLEAIGTSAYIVKYNSSNTQEWSVALTGSATITAIDTDAAGNIYVAGTLADEVEFGSTDGNAMVKKGLKLEEEYTVGQNASFIAKYDAAGKLLAARSFVPEALSTLAATGMYYPTDGDFYFAVNEIKVDGSKVYASVRYKGETTIDGVKFEGTYQDPWGGVYFVDLMGVSVFSLDCTTLNSCSTEASFNVDGPVLTDEAPRLISGTFTVNGGKVYAGVIAYGVGKINAVNGAFKEEVVLDGSTIEYLVASDSKLVSLKKANGEAIKSCDNLAGMAVSNGMLYVLGTSDTVLPAAEASAATTKTTGLSDVFVATYDASAMTLKSVIANANDEGSSMIESASKNNFEEAAGFALVDGSLYINTVVCNYNEDFLSLGSYWFDGSAFSYAPVAATGVAVGKGVLALVASDATKVDYSTYTFEVKQSGIDGIGADFDENAPVEYFNLQGIRVANPENGFYIRRQGNKVEKVIL